MTEKEILQYNKRCAKFLGFKYHEGSEYWTTMLWGGAGFTLRQMKFHSDWNWIMEVKNHIIGLGYCWFQFPDTIQINENSTMSSKSICKVRFHKLQEKEAVVEAINQFLIWYEQNK